MSAPQRRKGAGAKFSWCARKELGQWGERKEVGGKDGEPVKVEVVYVNDWRSRHSE